MPTADVEVIDKQNVGVSVTNQNIKVVESQNDSAANQNIEVVESQNVDVSAADQGVEVSVERTVVSFTEPGSELPAVDKDDNGKILQVVNGKWQAEEFKETELATDEEVTQILETVYGENPDNIPEDELITEDDFATDEEVEDMLNGIFGGN